MTYAAAADPLTGLLDRLEGVRRSGSGWMARCPAHDDHDPSLSLSRGDDGRALARCHAGCTTESVMAAAGLGMIDLFPHTNGASGPPRPAEDGHETRYRVRLADGSHAGEVFEHVRLDVPDGSKKVWWERGGKKGLRGVSPSAFALHGIDDPLIWDADTVVITEGEPPAAALRAIGIAAVGTVTGAKATPCQEAWEPLRGKEAIPWPDADEPGTEHMLKIAAVIGGVVASVRLVTPPADVKPGWDAADATAEEARRLIEEATSLPSQAQEPVLLPPPKAPMRVARRFVADRYTDDDGNTVLRFWRGGFYGFDGIRWPERDEVAIRAELYAYLEHAVYEQATPHGPEIRPWDPTKAKVSNVIEALQAAIHLDRSVQPPEWLSDAADMPEAADLIVVANGILHVPTRRLLPHDPRLFVGHCVPFAYDPDAKTPRKWLAFLDELWGTDEESKALLQEVFGYVLSGDTSLQKIMLLVGPPRAGKGVIARVQTALLGPAEVGAPTLAGLTTNFGLQDLIGKSLAIVSDARLGPRANVQALAERLLSVSGEDSITVDRKYRQPWTGRLGVCFLLLTNELPRFTDASGALAKRFVVLVLTQTFYGRENPALTDELTTELTGILGWSLDGLDRLRQQGRFTMPASAEDAIQDLEDLASPMAAFLRDRCVVERDQRVTVATLWSSWKEWTEDQGLHTGTKATFGRDLRAAVPGLKPVRFRDGDERERGYAGVGLRDLGGNDGEVRGPRGPGHPEGHGDDAEGPAGPRTAPMYVARAEVTETVDCADYELHRDAHRRIDGAWTCDRCLDGFA